ncbi:MAG: dihydroneopterin aldolase [Parvibaculaceae bacterium]
MSHRMSPPSGAETDNVTRLKIADAAQAIRHVFVRDLVLEGEIGVYAHEKDGFRQPMRFNIDLTVREAAHGDALENVVCYEQIVNKVKDLLCEGHVNLVETLAERIASRCLEDPRVDCARVRVEKLAAIAEVASVGVEIERRRSGV